MTNLYDTSFFLHVAVCAVLVAAFVLYLKPWRRQKQDAEGRYADMANDIIVRIMSCKTHEEVKEWQDKVDQFYLDNYDMLGYDKSIRLYEEMSAAVITRIKQLRSAGIKH